MERKKMPEELEQLAEKARQTEVPWDELREARGLKSALEAWKDEQAQPAVPRAPANDTRNLRWLAWAGAAAAVVALGISGYALNRGLDAQGQGGQGATAPVVANSDAEETAPEAGTATDAAPAQPEKKFEAPDASPTLTLSDGSLAMLSMDANVVIAQETTGEVRLRQSAGEVRYEVNHDPDRKFVVEAAGVEVEVVGTVFVVLIASDSVDVSVERGKVEVYDGKRRFPLASGEKVSVRHAQAEAMPADVEPAAERPAVPSAAELMGQYDQHRADGKQDLAAEALRTLIKSHPRDSRVPVALISLGEVEKQRGRHTAAARAFETYWKKHRKQPNAEDALAEAAKSWNAAGKSDRARDAASRYLEAFPTGLHASAMKKLSE